MKVGLSESLGFPPALYLLQKRFEFFYKLPFALTDKLLYSLLLAEINREEGLIVQQARF